MFRCQSFPLFMPRALSFSFHSIFGTTINAITTVRLSVEQCGVLNLSLSCVPLHETDYRALFMRFSPRSLPFSGPGRFIDHSKAIWNPFSSALRAVPGIFNSLQLYSRYFLPRFLLALPLLLLLLVPPMLHLVAVVLLVPHSWQRTKSNRVVEKERERRPDRTRD